MTSVAAGRGDLAGLFSGVAFKSLSAVETNPGSSNQHEFNGSRALLELFGRNGPLRIPTEFVWMPDDGRFIRQSGMLTWYDARARHPTRSEYRLYYVGNEVTDRARAGDFLLIARRKSGSTLMLLAPGSGTAAARIAWLFGIEATRGSAFAALSLEAEEKSHLALEFGVSGDADEQVWEGERVSASLPGDLSIRASLLKLQRDIGRERAVEIEGGWLAEEDGGSSSPWR